MISIPDRLLINGRDPVQEFEPLEKLYFRFNSSHYSSDYRIPVAAIRFPDFSVNRGLFSEPIDVLIPHWAEWGIVEVSEGDIPRKLPVPTQGQQAERNIDFQTVHDPIGSDHQYYNHPQQQFENYAHCEIRVFENGERSGQNNLPNSVKKLFRTILSDKATKGAIIWGAV